MPRICPAVEQTSLVRPAGAQAPTELGERRREASLEGKKRRPARRLKPARPGRSPPVGDWKPATTGRSGGGAGSGSNSAWATPTDASAEHNYRRKADARRSATGAHGPRHSCRHCCWAPEEDQQEAGAGDPLQELRRESRRRRRLVRDFSGVGGARGSAYADFSSSLVLAAGLQPYTPGFDSWKPGGGCNWAFIFDWR